MFKIRLFSFVLTLVVIFGFAQDSFADRRSYVWTYEYQTMPKGMWELEYYFTTEIPNIHHSNVNTLKPWVELEYGITNNWDISMYQMYKFQNRKTGDGARYDGFKIRTRYRFGKKGEFLVDPLVYLEYIREPDFHKPNIIELKIILAKDIGDFNLSYNQIAKRNLEKGKTENEYASGISYRFSPFFTFGLESKGNYSKEKFGFGPTFLFAAKKFWVTWGTVFGLNKKADDIQTRMIVGVPF